MITCDVLGHGPANNGLGNQMFAIATTLSLAIDNNDVAVFPDLNEPHYNFYARTIFHKLDTGINKNFVQNHYKERPYTSTIYEKIPYQENLCISGHFQSYKYFDQNKDKIKQIFTLPEFLTESIEEKFFDIIDSDNSVSIHIRRGDYLDLKGHYAFLDEEYYRQALDIIKDYSKIVVFSDDIEWCKNVSLFKNKQVLFIENQLDIIDLYLMSRIKNNIIANSTFSWWAAFLNCNENKKVIAPLKWFGPKRSRDNIKETKDLMPPSWNRI